MTEQVLVASLGTEPQVVTLVLDLLQSKGYAISEVIVVHTAGEVVRPALAELAREFAAPGAPAYRAVLIEDAGQPVADIVTEADTAAVLRTLYQVVLDQKRAGQLVHLSIAGGRKPMAVYGMVVAQLLFEEDGRCDTCRRRGGGYGDEGTSTPGRGRVTREWITRAWSSGRRPGAGRDVPPGRARWHGKPGRG